ncbi:MAG: cadherin-like domain-containing protein, partial [Gammaproteobacteria bacterium]|nr:cadherin-like domain-containing protein [Gammaproteobacteria bacterium]
LDANGDGINDNFDFDLDGISDHIDVDADNDGIPDAIEANNGSAPTNYNTTTGRITGAVGANGMPDAVETSSESGVSIYPNGDADGDGNKNFKDIDSDNDGITDAVEANGGTAPANYDSNKGVIATAAGSNGWPDSADPSDGGTALSNPNSDADTHVDYLDIDADNDGIVDNIEGQSTLGYVGPTGSDTDGDGWDNAYDPDNSGTPITIYNFDGTDTPDYIDTDSDNDGVLDIREGHDNDSEGTGDWDTSVENDIVDAAENSGSSLTDADNDGLLDLWDPDYITCTYDSIQSQGDASGENGGCARIQNTDGADDRDWRDIDDDNDGILTTDELNDFIGVSGVKDYLENPCASGQLPRDVQDTLYATSVIDIRFNNNDSPSDSANLLGSPDGTFVAEDFKKFGDSVILDMGQTIAAGTEIRTFIITWANADTELDAYFSNDNSSYTLDTSWTRAAATQYDLDTISEYSSTDVVYIVSAFPSNAYRYVKFRVTENENKVDIDAVEVLSNYLECIEPIVAVFDSTSTLENTDVNINIQLNDTNNTATSPLNVVVLDSLLNNGSVSVNIDGTVTYTPNANFNGIDSFYYQVCSDGGHCDTALVKITIDPSPCPDGKQTEFIADTLYATSVIDIRFNNNDSPSDSANLLGSPDGTFVAEDFKKYGDSVILDMGQSIAAGTEIRTFIITWANVDTELDAYFSNDNSTYTLDTSWTRAAATQYDLDTISEYSSTDVVYIVSAFPSNAYRYVKFRVTENENKVDIDAVEALSNYANCINPKPVALNDTVSTPF